MSIVIDGIIFSLQPAGGISVYFRELIRRLQRDQKELILNLYAPLLQEPPQQWNADITPGVSVIESRILERYRRCIISGDVSRGSAFHSSYYRRSNKQTIPSIVTVYDFTYERVVTGLRRWVHSYQKISAIRSASAVICISNATRDDLRTYVGEAPEQDVRVIHLAAGEEFRPIAMEPSEKPFVMFVGQRRDRYKNFAMVLGALTLLSDFELICVGGGPLRAEELVGVDNSVRERVRHAGAVSGGRMNELYNQATCLAYPSSHEGFGIPVLEAMQAGCPVVSTKCKAVLEIGGDALTVAELDPVDLARCILQTASPSYRINKVRAGLSIAQNYSWEDTYQRTLDVYRSFA